MVEQTVLIAIIAAAGGTAFLFVAIVVFYCWYRHRSKRRGIEKTGLSVYLEQAPLITSSGTHYEEPITLANLYLRSSTTYAFKEEIPHFGARQEKGYFLVQVKSARSDKLMTLVPIVSSELSLSTESNRALFKKFLMALNHPFIYSIKDVGVLSGSDFVVLFREFSHRGSLRDLINKTKPTSATYTKRYGAAFPSSLPAPKIALYGKCVLEALSYLEQTHLMIGFHCHAGNVILTNDYCCLTDFENALLGNDTTSLFGRVVQGLEKSARSRVASNPFNRGVNSARSGGFFASLKEKLKNEKISAEVLAFGGLLFEMALGCELSEIPTDMTVFQSLKAIQEFQILPAPVKELILYIFENEETVTINSLLNHPFFTSVRFSNEVESAMESSKKTKPKKFGEKRKGKMRQSGLNSSTASLTRISSPEVSKASVTSPVITPKTNAPVQPPAAAPAVIPPPPLFAPAPPAPPPPPPPSVSAPSLPSVPSERGQLLSSIRSFSNKKLKKAVTVDKSAPKFK